MKLLDGLQLRGAPATIPESTRNELPELFQALGFQIGAEIGVYKGAFTERFCKAGMTIYAVDPWSAYDTNGRAFQSQERQNFLYGHAQRALAPYLNCTIIRKTSMDALHLFRNGTLDFVYIDANHSFRYIASDLQEWAWKVRKGGIVAGHDYFNTAPSTKNVIIHVKPVVDAYMEAFGIKNWYVFGGSGADKDDKFLSWMWIRE